MLEKPTTHELLKARFAQVRRHLDQAIAGVTDDLITWSPGEGMRTVGGQLFEILGKEIEFLTFAKARGEEEWIEIDEPEITTIDAWKSLLRKTREETLAYLDTLSEEDLNQLVTFPEPNWWEGMYLPAIPLHEVFRSIAAHEWYHTGQLVIYRWSPEDDD